MAITRAISIVNYGVGVAAIGVSSGNAITITAGATDSVHLRGLTIEGLSSAVNGIQFSCVVRGIRNAAINISPNTPSSFSASNTTASNNSENGILVQPTGSTVVEGVLSKVTANNNSIDGIIVDIGVTTAASLNVTVVDSVASNNSGNGVEASGGPGLAVMLRNSVVSYNVTGISRFGSSCHSFCRAFGGSRGILLE